MRYYTIVLDGIDKSGKDLIMRYVSRMSNHRFLVYSRGIISMIAYSKLYNRNYFYDIEHQQNVVNVMLTVDKEDWRIRCDISNEPTISYDDNLKVFEETYNELKKFDRIKLLKYNTSELTPYEIAKEILEYIYKLNIEEGFDIDF